MSISTLSEHVEACSMACDKIKGPDNPTFQLFPVSHQKEVKTEWERQERDMVFAKANR